MGAEILYKSFIEELKYIHSKKSDEEWKAIFKRGTEKIKSLKKIEGLIKDTLYTEKAMRHATDCFVLDELLNSLGAVDSAVLIEIIRMNSGYINKVKNVCEVSKETGIPLGILFAIKNYLKYKKEGI